MKNALTGLAISGTLLAAPLVALASPAVSEEDLVCAYSVEGPITASTAERFAADLAALGQVREGEALCLNSPGGSLKAALEIARLAKEKAIPAAVKGNATCLSACAIAFLGGTGSIGMWSFPSRTLYPGGDLGIHGPDLPLPPGQYSSEQVRAAYALALETVAAVLDFGRERYLTGSSTPMNDFLVRTFIGTPPGGDTFWRPRTVEDAIRADIDLGVIGLRASPATYMNICDNFVARYGWDGSEPRPTKSIIEERIRQEFTSQNVVTDESHAWVGGYWRGGRNTMACRVTLEPVTSYAATDSYLVSLIGHEWGAKYPLESEQVNGDFFSAPASPTYTYRFDTLILETRALR